MTNANGNEKNSQTLDQAPPDAQIPTTIENPTVYVQPEAQPYIEIASELMRRAIAGEAPDALNNFLSEALYRVGGTLDDTSIMHWHETFDYYESVLTERLRRRESGERQLRWPWASWNNYIDPPDPGMLVIVGAPDGLGKTVLVENIAEQIAQDGGHVLFFHLELAPELMFDRRTARHAFIDRRSLKMDINKDVIRVVRDTNMRLRSWPGQITYVHSPGWTIDKIADVIRGIHRQDPVDMVIVDYLQKVRHTSDQMRMFGANTTAREADTIERFKIVAEREALPIVLISQMRKDAKGATTASGLSREQLLGTGSISNRSNVVVLMTRETDEDGVKTPIIHVKIDKNTMGREGAFLMVINGPRFDIRDFSHELLENILNSGVDI